MDTDSQTVVQDPESEYPIKQFLELVLLEKIKTCVNPYVTYETLVLRVFQDLAHLTHIPWSGILDAVARPCVLDSKLHDIILSLWEERKRNTTLDEQQALERLLGHDHVRHADILKLASYLGKPNNGDMKPIWKLFAVDGLSGSELKNYADNFKRDDFKWQHAQAVRELYAFVDTPETMKEIVEMAFEGTTTCTGSVATCVDLYLRMVPRIKDVKQWKLAQMEEKKGKKTLKRKAEELTVEEGSTSEVKTTDE